MTDKIMSSLRTHTTTTATTTKLVNAHHKTWRNTAGDSAP